MDLALIIWQQYNSQVNQLVQSANEIRRARREQKKLLKQKFEQQHKELLKRVQVDFPSKMYQNFALMVLYQEAGLIDVDVANDLREAWQKAVIQHQMQDIHKWNVDGLLREIAMPKPDLDLLPSGSWFIQFDFELAKPYISHDDVSSYIIDNPVASDHVFGLPMIRASSWKGNLRSALRRTENWDDTRPEIVRLFGNPKVEDEDFRAGCLEFYPTFFCCVGLEIINPHDRARKVGTNPILFECVPAGAKGTFSLLYVPFDLIGEDEEEIRQQAADDLRLIAEAMSAMMLTYGFSAKRTSGYGTAKDEIWGRVITQRGEKPLTRLSNLAQEVNNVGF